MRALAITDKGVEWAASLEVEEKLESDCEERDRCVVFDADLLGLCELCYTGQSVRKVLLLACEHEAKDLSGFETISGMLEGFDLEAWFDEDTTFKVSCYRVGEHPFSSPDVEREVGAQVIEAVEEQSGFTPDVSLEDPDLVFCSFVNGDDAYLGIDLAGRDLSQRDYKLYQHPATIRGSIAYASVRMAGYEKDDVLLDPFCGSAPIPLEAAYHASRLPVWSQDREMAFMGLKPLQDTDWKEWFRDINKNTSLDGLEIYAFDKSLMNLNYGKDNAEVAGLGDMIRFSKKAVEWLDTEFDEGEVDCIVTQPPQDTKSSDTEHIKEIYDELFYQADFVLSEDGCVVALLLEKERFVEAAEHHGFELDDEREVVVGDLDYALVKLKAKT